MGYVALGNGRTVTMKIDPDGLPRPGQTLGITFDQTRTQLFSTEGERIRLEGDERQCRVPAWNSRQRPVPSCTA